MKGYENEKENETKQGIKTKTKGNENKVDENEKKESHKKK